MSAERMPKCPASASEGFSSTPVKILQSKDVLTPEDDVVVSVDEDTFSLLSPIYHDSFDVEDEDSKRCSSPGRCELPQRSLQEMSNPLSVSHSLGAWETWLINKAKEDRLKLERRAEEEFLLKERKEQQERRQQQKKAVIEEKIQLWLKYKNEQERHEQLVKQKEEKEQMQRQEEKQREIQLKAEQKYRDWLQKKNQQKHEKERREKQENALKETQETERRKRAEEKFKEWLVKANEKSRASTKSPRSPAGVYASSCPAPSFCNPIPWKPIHVPPPEMPPNKTSGKNTHKHKNLPSPGTPFRPGSAVSSKCSLQRR